MRRAILIAGATASGKSDVGEAVARAIGGEVVCADARQVFGELEIGTGKPTPAERAALPHHLFDALTLGERPSAGWFAREAGCVAEDLFARGVTPVFVGGSGLYVRALLEGLHALPEHDPAAREALMQELAAAGPEALHQRLAQLDPDAASRIEPGDRQRIVRALEVHATSGRALSDWHADGPRSGLAAHWHVFLVQWDSAELGERIVRRTHAMFEGGLIAETQGLLAAGKGASLAALHAIGYDEALDVLAGRADGQAARLRTTQRTRQLAKRQRTWFRHQLKARNLAGREGTGRLRDTILAGLSGAGA
jgi:tRNA dimethylallyltransferase